MSSAMVASDVLSVPPGPLPREGAASPGARPGHPLWRARPYRADVWLAIGLAVATITVTLVSSGRAPYHPPDAVTAALATVSALALAWRQAAPLAAMAVTSTIVAVNAAAGYAVVAVQWPAWLALFGCFSVGGRGVRIASTALCVMAVGGYALFDRGALTVEDMAGITMSFLIATVGGDAARSRRAVAAAQHAQVRGEAREQALAAERLLHEERGRLAGELHDALGHTVNVMVLQAGAQGLAALADRIRATGREVDLDAEPVDLSAGSERVLYRIVREALTNAVRHTDTGRIRVRVSRVADQIRVEVFNEGAGFASPVPGRGLIGMRERARLEGGSFEAGPVEGGFRVLATLPTHPATGS
ncbi:sensor histidine kinase [Parafrankia soli]|uniref:sensor histidine kinase n=1 Tax=Parafrankia soli TaxID=2599596 RepID=UPI001F51649A|nr:sensor histidine kinase [Parafrankia soli]